VRFGWILPHLGCFGSIREVLELSNALVDAGHDVTVHTPDGEPCRWLPYNGQVATCEQVPQTDYDLMLMVSEWRRGDYDLLLASPSRMRGVVMMGFTPGCELAELLHDWSHTPSGGTKVLAAALQNPDLVVFADGAWQLDWLAQNVGTMQAKIGIALGGVNSRMFRPSTEGNGDVAIGASGDSRGRKGSDTVREAAAIICNKHPRLILRNYWGTPTQESLVTFLQETTIFLDGHRRGGWCNPVLEAMACGCAVVCTEIGATEFVIDGVNGRRVPMDDAETMADVVLWYLGDEGRIRRIAIKARETAESLDYRQVAPRLVKYVEGNSEHSTIAIG